MQSPSCLFDDDEQEAPGDLPEYDLPIDEWSVTDQDGDDAEQSGDGGDSLSSNDEPTTTRTGGTIFCEAELDILTNARPEWLRLSGTVRTDHVYRICEQLAVLDDVQDFSDDEWVVRVAQYKRWFWNQARSLHRDKRIKVGHGWSIRKVLKHKYKAEILAAIRETYRFVPGSHDELRVYQVEASKFIQTLSVDQITEAEDLLEEWTSGNGPPPDVKASNAAKYGEDIFMDVAREMWRSCGMRVVVLAGWRNEKGDLVTYTGDYNERIGNGDNFHAVGEIQDAWGEFIGAHLEVVGDGNEIPDGGGDATAKGGKGKKKKPDPTANVIAENGNISVPDIDNMARDEVLRTVRGFFTAKYRETCGKASATAPFNKLAARWREMIDARHLPFGFVFPGDPSHMHVNDARDLLQFLRTRQLTHPEDPFEFHHWVNTQGELQDPFDIVTHMRQQRKAEKQMSKALSRGRHKGKAKASGSIARTRRNEPAGPSRIALRGPSSAPPAAGQGRVIEPDNAVAGPSHTPQDPANCRGAAHDAPATVRPLPTFRPKDDNPPTIRNKDGLTRRANAEGVDVPRQLGIAKENLRITRNVAEKIEPPELLHECDAEDEAPKGHRVNVPLQQPKATASIGHTHRIKSRAPSLPQSSGHSEGSSESSDSDAVGLAAPNRADTPPGRRRLNIAAQQLKATAHKRPPAVPMRQVRQPTPAPCQSSPHSAQSAASSDDDAGGLDINDRADQPPSRHAPNIAAQQLRATARNRPSAVPMRQVRQRTPALGQSSAHSANAAESSNDDIGGLEADDRADHLPSRHGPNIAAQQPRATARKRPSAAPIRQVRQPTPAPAQFPPHFAAVRGRQSAAPAKRDNPNQAAVSATRANSPDSHQSVADASDHATPPPQPIPPGTESCTTARRSSRSRKVPLPADADIPTPVKRTAKTPKKRNNTGPSRGNEKRTRR